VRPGVNDGQDSILAALESIAADPPAEVRLSVVKSLR
jgi:hypothetical protein